MKSLIEKISVFKDMAITDLQEAIDSIPKEKLDQAESRIHYSPHGKFHRAFEQRSKHLLSSERKSDRSRMREQLKSKYGVLEVTLNEKPLYVSSGSAELDNILSIFRSYHAN